VTLDNVDLAKKKNSNQIIDEIFYDVKQHVNWEIKQVDKMFF